MIPKVLLIGFLGLLSVLSPPVFAGIMSLVLISVMVYNVEIGLERYAKTLVKAYGKRPPRLPCNFLVLGLLLAVSFTICGFVWDINPQFGAQMLDALRTLLSIGLQFGCWMVMVGCTHKFVKLVD